MVNKYKKNKEKLRKETRERYQKFPEAKKEKWLKTVRDRYKNIS